MNMLSASFILSALVIVTACSDSNSVTQINTDSADETLVDSITENNTGANEDTETANNGTTETGSTTGTEQTANTDEGDTSDTDTETTQMNESAAGESAPAFADYRITFDGTWSAATHPTQFPANAHFSGLVGAVHNDQVNFWEPGQIATDGIELMAETGGKSIFLDEINSAIDSGYALSAIDGPGISVAPGTGSVDIRVTVDYPLVTLTTMLAPSPDWFAGFHNIRFFSDGAFIDSLSIEGIVYDSGTDSGASFTSGNSDTQPRDIIVRTTSEPTDSPFIQGLPTAGQFIIEKL